MTDPDAPLAKRALQTYDTQGERAMLHFIAPHIVPSPPDAQQNNHSLIVLRDHTCIQSAEFLYNFLWMEDEPHKDRNITTDKLANRPAGVPRSLRPVRAPTTGPT